MNYSINMNNLNITTIILILLFIEIQDCSAANKDLTKRSEFKAILYMLIAIFSFMIISFIYYLMKQICPQGPSFSGLDLDDIRIEELNDIESSLQTSIIQLQSKLAYHRKKKNLIQNDRDIKLSLELSSKPSSNNNNNNRNNNIYNNNNNISSPIHNMKPPNKTSNNNYNKNLLNSIPSNSSFKLDHAVIINNTTTNNLNNSNNTISQEDHSDNADSEKEDLWGHWNKIKQNNNNNILPEDSRTNTKFRNNTSTIGSSSSIQSNYNQARQRGDKYKYHNETSNNNKEDMIESTLPLLKTTNNNSNNNSNNNNNNNNNNNTINNKISPTILDLNSLTIPPKNIKPPPQPTTLRPSPSATIVIPQIQTNEYSLNIMHSNSNINNNNSNTDNNNNNYTTSSSNRNEKKPYDNGDNQMQHQIQTRPLIETESIRQSLSKGPMLSNKPPTSYKPIIRDNSSTNTTNINSDKIDNNDNNNLKATIVKKLRRPSPPVIKLLHPLENLKEI